MKKLGTILLAIMMAVPVVSADSGIVFPQSMGEQIWYRLNDPLGTTTSAADSSGRDNDGLMEWDAGAIHTAGYTGSSLNFTADTMRVVSPTNTGVSGDFTWSVKIKTTQATYGGIISHSYLQNDNDTVNFSQSLSVINGKAWFYVAGKNRINTQATINDGQWHTITVVNTWENVLIYLDGVNAALEYQWGAGNNWFPGLATATDNFKYWLGTSHYGKFEGEMKDVRFFDRKLTDAQIQMLNDYGETEINPNLILHYKMNEAPGHVGFTDSSFRGYDAGMAWDTPESPHVSNFTGSSFAFANDSVRTWASKTYSFPTSAPFTWAVWVKTTNGGTLFNRCAETNPWVWDIEGYKQFSLTTTPQFETAGLPFFSVVGEYPATGTISVADGKWHHIAATFDGEGTVRLYIDGQLNVEQGVPLHEHVEPPNYMFFFGLGAGIRYLGEMADLRIYDKELTAQELSQLAWVGDFDGDREVDFNDLNMLTEEWLNDYSASPLLVDQVENGNFEAYGAEIQFGTHWEEYYYAPVYLGSTSSSEISLITNPANSHTGSNALRWTYNSVDTSGNNYNFTEIIYYFDNHVINLSNYDQMRVWIKRHSGNSQENLLYIKFFDYGYDIGNIAAEAWLVQSEGSSYAEPDQWYQWAIDLKGMKFGNGYANTSDIIELTAIMFGVSDDNGTGGTGTIDIDDITFVKLPTCSEQKDQDLNYDCTINFSDFVIFAQNWLMK